MAPGPGTAVEKSTSKERVSMSKYLSSNEQQSLGRSVHRPIHHTPLAESFRPRLSVHLSQQDADHGALLVGRVLARPTSDRARDGTTVERAPCKVHGMAEIRMRVPVENDCLILTCTYEQLVKGGGGVGCKCKIACEQ